ncbi:MAG: D-alanyl-D-alanine carboxypeptidase/D-alanyl-D-alanine endopeptidase [Pseudobacter sp.]|uniref:D-alanyl-D-alanine carboxypeptidase/D-alanyl-D-alanine endopeptidase n=1 Tax=Pseudobacter sp. TaxID=2045420 RepID=UPI003F805066
MKVCSWSSLVIILLASACTTSRIPGNNSRPDYVQEHLLNDSTLQQAQVGVAVYDPSTGKFLHNYQGNKYFTPASNVKLFSCYAAMKYLGDSLTGIQYFENDTAIFLIPTGDPTLLHPDYRNQPVIRFLQQSKKPLYINKPIWKSEAWGRGWSWDDYNDDYMVERSPLPVYGNVVEWVQEYNQPVVRDANGFLPSPSLYSNPEVNWKVRFTADTAATFNVQRALSENIFHVTQSSQAKATQHVPFVTGGLQAALELLPDTVGKEIGETSNATLRKFYRAGLQLISLGNIASQPLDSLLKPMMYRSDNFFADQCLQMVSYQLLQEFNERKLIDTLLQTDLKDLPHPPSWADGSGLSRFNLFTPEDFVAILQKMEKEFGMERLKGILATGGKGTLKNYYNADSGYVYAKTGTLSGVVALSGFLITQQNKKLIFSVLVNNHNGNPVTIRRKVEAFLTEIRKNN